MGGGGGGSTLGGRSYPHNGGMRETYSFNLTCETNDSHPRSLASETMLEELIMYKVRCVCAVLCSLVICLLGLNNSSSRNLTWLNNQTQAATYHEGSVFSFFGHGNRQSEAALYSLALGELVVIRGSSRHLVLCSSCCSTQERGVASIG